MGCKVSDTTEETLLHVQRTHAALICCSDEDYRWLARGHMVWGWKGPNKIHPVTTHLIYYPILPGTLKIPVTGNSFWVQCPTFITPLGQQSPELPKHKGERVGFPWHQICGVSRNNIQLPKHPWGVQQHNLIRRGNQGRSHVFGMLSLRIVLSSGANHVCLFLMIWQSV